MQGWQGWSALRLCKINNILPFRASRIGRVPYDALSRRKSKVRLSENNYILPSRTFGVGLAQYAYACGKARFAFFLLGKSFRALRSLLQGL